MRKGTQEITRVYKRGNSKNYYFQWSDNNGVRHQTSTKTNNKKEAFSYANKFIGNSANFEADIISLKDWITLFVNVKTNPRRKSAKLNGTRFSDSYSELQSRTAKNLLTVLKTKPALLNKSISKIIRLDILNIKELIIQGKGHCRTSQILFSFVKIAFTEAYQEGIIDSNPGSEISNIHYKEKKRQAIPAYILANLIKDRNAFRSIEAWAFFTVLATTGMRRGEVLGITPSRINNGVLTIDRQWNMKKFIEPKGGLTRIIPLSKLTIYALNCLEKPKTPDSLYFNKHCNWISACFGQARMYACAKFPDDVDILQGMTPHVLRHSLNTALLVSGLPAMLVAEYLSWEHQDLLRMQSRYTHLVSDNIIPVANKIDELFEPKETPFSNHISM
ncbi:MAG: tyrosine-type recombinase/integrase [Sphaerochaetaceae bacterium]|nr:tyrosine-type recombinase/integrase [Sphaerochaetaceae bacterium]